MKKEVLEQLQKAILEGDGDAAASRVSEGLGLGVSAVELMDQCVVAVRRVGELWEEGEYFLPELVSGGEAATAALDLLRPALVAEAPLTEKKTVVLGTVKGDIHDIGKSLVAHMLRARGLEVADLGNDVSADRFVEATLELEPDLVAISALLTTTMVYQKEVIDRLAEAGLRDRIKILVGGAPVTESWAREIGADGTADDAMQAANLACEMLGA